MKMNTLNYIISNYIVLTGSTAHQVPSRWPHKEADAKCTFSPAWALCWASQLSGPGANWMAWSWAKVATVGGRLNDHG